VPQCGVRECGVPGNGGLWLRDNVLDLGGGLEFCRGDGGGLEFCRGDGGGLLLI
jgi:hypothetical protein